MEHHQEKEFNKLIACYTDGSLTEMQKLENISTLDFHIFIDAKKDYLTLKNTTPENE